MANWTGMRPKITDGRMNYSSDGLQVAPDGDIDNARVVIAPDGVRLQPADFTGLKLRGFRFHDGRGTDTTLMSNASGHLIINGVDYIDRQLKEESKVVTLRDDLEAARSTISRQQIQLNDLLSRVSELEKKVNK